MSDGLAREGWDKDLRHGEAREDAFVHVFLRSRVEVKSDGICARTGNVFVEYKQKGRPSGIATTESGYYAFETMPENWSLVPTARLKHLARRAIKEGRTAYGGDRNEYLGALVPVEWLVRDVRPA